MGFLSPLLVYVIPAKAEIQKMLGISINLDSRFRGNDDRHLKKYLSSYNELL